MKMTPEEIDHKVEEIARRCKYEGYLLSPSWQKKRRTKLAQQEYTCENCHKCSYDGDLDLDVHHLTYEHLFNEPLSDLQVLCRDCHQKTHGREFPTAQQPARGAR